MKKIITSFLSFFITQNLFSMPAKIFTPPPYRISYSYTFPSTITVDDSSEISQSEIDFQGVVAKKDLSKDSFIIFGFRHHMELFRIQNTVLDQVDQEQNLYQIDLPITYIKNTENWFHVVRVAPGIYSDLTYINKDDLDAAITYLATYKSSETLQWIFGVGHNRFLGESLTFPILGFEYMPSEKLMIGAALPFIYASYTPDSFNLFQLSLTPAGNKWNINKNTEIEKNQSFNVLYRSFKAGVSYEKMFQNLFSLKFELGRNFYRELAYDQIDGSRNTLFIEDSEYLELAIRKRF